MQKSVFLQSLLVGAVMFGAIVGAGFASGKEVWFYFAQFGWICIPLIIIAGVLFFAIGYSFLEFGKQNGIESVEDLNGKIWGKVAFLGEIVFIFGNIVLLSSMFAGSNSLFDIVLSQNFYRYASVITALVAVLLSWLGFEKIVKVNLAVVPGLVLIVACSFVFCILNYNGFCVPNVGKQDVASAIFYCILYVCSNLYFAGFIFARLGRVHSSKVNFFGALIGSGFLVLCLIGMVVSIYLNPYSGMSDMPLVYIAGIVSDGFGIFTLIIVWVGILTTAVSLVYTISLWLQKYVHSFKIASVLVSIICLIISGLGFSKIVSYCYPILGIFGMLFIGVMLIKKFKNKLKYLKKHKKI